MVDGVQKPKSNLLADLSTQLRMEYIRRDNIKEAKYEKLLFDRDKLSMELDFLDSIIDHYRESVCDTCSTIEYAYEKIPDGWSIKKSEMTELVLCIKCNKKWRERFKEDE